jgi:hypothetical protein
MKVENRMIDNWHTKGPIVVWLNGGCEGWHPRSYATVKEALMDPERAGYCEFVITRVVEFDVVEKADERPPLVKTTGGGALTPDEPRTGVTEVRGDF